jgi:hypothetical protein
LSRTKYIKTQTKPATLLNFLNVSLLANPKTNTEYGKIFQGSDNFLSSVQIQLILCGDLIKRIEMGRPYGTYGREAGCMQLFGGGKNEGKKQLGKCGADGRIIFKWIFTK